MYEMVIRDILKEKPLPLVERAYTMVQREVARVSILRQSTIGEILISSDL